jgi:PKD repeat protein
MKILRQAFPLIFVILTPLSWGCYKNKPIPVASFTYESSHQFVAPCTVNFINQSTESWSYAWWFGTDSSTTTLNDPGSEEKNPSHIFYKPGNFRVMLRTYNESGKEWASMVSILVVKDSIK